MEIVGIIDSAHLPRGILVAFVSCRILYFNYVSKYMYVLIYLSKSYAVYSMVFVEKIKGVLPEEGSVMILASLIFLPFSILARWHF